MGGALGALRALDESFDAFVLWPTVRNATRDRTRPRSACSAPARLAIPCERPENCGLSAVGRAHPRDARARGAVTTMVTAAAPPLPELAGTPGAKIWCW